MLAPVDKLKNRGNNIIQIVVTTACDLYTCSNCTQLLPFRKDYRHMTLECFEKAVKSLRDWPGVVALFGGNPCTHPQFSDLCHILSLHIPDQSKRGLWSNNLMTHGPLVRRTFYPYGTFNLNVHRNTDAAAYIAEWLPGKLIQSSVRSQSWHSPILVSHQDIGVPESEWEELREHCDINQKWSAAIVEREGKPYAYFCEVAAALDGIRGLNHGVPVHYGWWQESMSAFQHQVAGCCDKGCGVPLRLKGHEDESKVYDTSKSFMSHVRQDSNVVALRFHATPPETTREVTDYLRLRER